MAQTSPLDCRLSMVRDCRDEGGSMRACMPAKARVMRARMTAKSSVGVRR